MLYIYIDIHKFGTTSVLRERGRWVWGIVCEFFSVVAKETKAVYREDIILCFVNERGAPTTIYSIFDPQVIKNPKQSQTQAKMQANTQTNIM